ncbi:MAG: hypothetical protein M1839_006545 [Geoglossum umbratile]|nr:MAG: hypothetical protein M1839_006545 [Geoglossum umbratile]
MPPRSEDITDEPPSSVNPYEVLGIEKNATESEVKSAYRKQALKHHPDKVSAEQRESANQAFQEIAFAYAILSDERRRKRYDTTGRTEETLDSEDLDFNWRDFYREQWRDVVTEEVIEKVKIEYRGSEEEKRDLLGYYEEFKGDMGKIFESVMCSDLLEDEDRFREIINDAIAAGEAVPYNSYIKESKGSKKRRRNEALKEAQEAREMAREMGLESELFGDETNEKSKKNKSKKGGDESALAALIMARQKDRSANFLDRLEAKYTSKNKPTPKGKKGKKRESAEMEEGEGGEDVDGEPPEEAFQEMAKKMKGKKGKVGGGVEEPASGESARAGRKSKRVRKG